MFHVKHIEPKIVEYSNLVLTKIMLDRRVRHNFNGQFGKFYEKL